MKKAFLSIARIKNLLKSHFPKFFSIIKLLWIKCGFYQKTYKTLLKTRFIRSNPTNEMLLSFEHQLSTHTRVFFDVSKATAISKLFHSVSIDPRGPRFFYSIDVFQMQPDRDRLMVNSTIDYQYIIRHSLQDLYLDESDVFSKENNTVCSSLLDYVTRCEEYILNSHYDNREQIANWLANMKTGPAQHFDEALQRVLFLNMVLWQTNHRLVGLGRLDFILDELYEHDKNEGIIDKDKATLIIMDFFSCLHQYYWFKSDALMGDTGQIIILSGKQPDGSCFYNDLTWCFIDAIERLQMPDPKVLLRVSNNTPVNLMEKAMLAIKTGVGNPLFSNDEIIIPSMIAFGYGVKDAYNYVTSACWEPLVPGCSHEQNNIGLYNFLLPLQMISEQGNLYSFKSFDSLFEKYCLHLCEHIDSINQKLTELRWEKDPLVSAFTEPCRQKHMDISDGGGKYNNFGVLTVAMANTVNALMIIKRYVFEEKLFELQFLDDLRKQNYSSHEDIRQFLQSKRFFGTDNNEAIDLTRKILRIVSEHISGYRNPFGGKIKFGLSSPGYISAAKDFPASLDGRKDGEPFAVHISGDDSASYTELMKFSSKLDYSEDRFNGNVTDLFVSPSIILGNEEKFSQFMLDSLKMGVFQTQFNVVSSKTLIAARAEPDKYPDLIVRVWGFSAYYVELPDEYKDYLIQRALKCEGAA